MKTSFGALPPGPYLLEIIGCEDATKDSRDRETPAYRLTWKLLGYDLVFFQFVSSLPSVRWFYQDWAMNGFESLPNAVGRKFLVLVGQEEVVRGKVRNRVKAVLAEIVS